MVISLSDSLWTIMQATLNYSNHKDKFYNLKKVMDIWTKRYPVLNVIQNYENDHITILQKNNEQNKWWISMTYTMEIYPNFIEIWPPTNG